MENLLFTGSNFTVTPSVTTNYWVSQAANGCESARTLRTVTVTPVVAPTASATAICPGETSVATATTGGANGVFNWYDAASGGNLLGTGNPFMVAPSATTNYWVSEVLNGCESARTLFVVTVTPLAVPFAATPAAICPGQTTTLVASGNLANGVFKWYDAATSGNLVYTGNNFTVSPSFTTDYWVTESNATCESDRFLVTVTVNPLNDPTVNAGSVCPGQTFDLVATSGGANGIFEWFDASGNLLFVGNPFTVSPSATTDYFVVEMANGCQTNAIQTTVTVAPLAAVTAPNLSTCPGNSVTFVATGAVAGGVYNWYNAATGGNLLFTGSNFTVTPSVTTNYWVSQAANGCESARTLRTVTVTPVTAPTASATAICPGETSVATATTGGANGVFNWYDASSGGNLLGTGNPFMVAPSTTTNYWVSETLNNCESARTLFLVTVTPLAVPFAATPAAICPGQTTTLVASGNLANGVFKWYDAATNGNLIYTGNNFTVSPSFTTDYWVTESNATCESDRFLVTVTVNPLNDPTVNAGSVCPGQTFDLVATSGGANGIFEWFDASGNLLFVGNPFTVSPSSTTDYFVVEMANGCQTNAIQTTVTVAPLATVTAPNLATCPGNSVTFVATGAVAGGVYNWYNAATGGNLLFTGSNFTVTPSVTTNYWVSQAANGCESARTLRTITVTPVVAPTASPTAICPGETSVATATTGGANGVFNWYDASSGGNLLGTGNPFMVAPSTTTNYWVSETLNNCESARTLFTVTVTPLAVPFAATPAAICPGQTTTLVASGNLANGVFKWYDAATNGNLIYTGNNFTVSPSFTTDYWVTESNATCESDRFLVTVTVNPLNDPTVNAGSVCPGQTFDLVATSGGANGIFEWFDASGNLLFVGNPFTVNPSATTDYFVVEMVNGCQTNAIQTTVTVAPLAAVTAPNLATCPGNSVTFVATGAVAGGVYNWYNAATGGNLLFTGSNFTVTPSVTTNYWVSQAANGCESARTLRTVTVTPVVAPTASATAICPGETSVATATTGGANGVFNWYDASSGGNLLGTGNPFMVAPSTTTNYWVSETLNNCESARTLFVVTVTPLAVPFAATPAAICPGQTTTLVASGALANGVFKWYDAATNGNLVYTGNNYTVSPSFTTDYWVTESNATCESDRFLVTVTVNPLNDPTSNSGTVCPGQTFDLVATSGGANGIFEWFDASGNLLFVGNPFTVNPSSTTDYFVVEMANGCQTNAIQTTVTVAPLAAVTAPNLSTCPGNSVTFVATGAVAGGVYNWYNAATGGNLLFTGSNFTVTPSATTNYWVSQAANGCESARTQRTVTVTPVTAPTASATAICPGETSVATAVTGGANGVFNWYDASAGGNLLGTGNPFMVSPSTTTNYWVSETLNNCESARSLFVVTVTPLAVPFAATPAAICPGQTTTLVASGALANGVFKWYDAATNGNLIYTGNNFTVSPSFTTDYWVTESNATCESDRFLVTVTVNPLNDPTVNAGSVCPGQTFDLVATSGGANGIFEWFDASGNLLFVGNPFTVSPSATTDYFVVEMANGCQTNAIQTTVTVAPLAAVTAPNLSTCPGNSVTFVATGAVAGGVYNWYNAATGGNLLFTGSNFTVTPSATTNYWVSQAANGCESARTQRTVTVTPVTAPTASATAICPGETSVATAVTGGANGVFNWYDASSGGNLLGTGNPFMVAPSTTTNYWVSETLNNCESARTLFVVTVTPLAVPFAATPAAICPGQTTTLVASGALANGVFKWYDAATNGNLIYTGNNFTVSPSFTTDYWVTESNATCESDRFLVTVTVNSLNDPTTNAGSVCPGQTFDLVATSGGANGIFEWTDINGNLLFVGNPFTVNPSATTDYFVTEKINGCQTNAIQTTVTVAPLAAVTAPNLSTCPGNSVTFVATGAVAGGVYNWYNAATGGNLLFTGSNFTVTPSATTNYWVSQAANGCESARTQRTVTVTPVVAPTASATAICPGETSVATATTGGANGVFNWYDASSGGNLLGTGNPFMVAPSTTTNYWVSETLNNCESARTLFVVTVTPLAVPFAATPAAICPGQTTTLVASGALANGVFKWYDAATNGNLIYTGNNFTVSPSFTTDYWVTESNATCESDRFLVTVTVNPLNDPTTNAGSVCPGQTFDLVATSGGANGIFEWFDASGNLLFVGNPFTVNPSSTTDYFVVEMANGCQTNAIQTTVTVAPLAAVTAPNLSTCPGNSVTFVATGAVAGGVYNWYNAATGGNLLFTGSNFTVTPSATTNYWVSQAANGCESARTQRTVTVTPVTAPTASATAICPGETSVATAVTGGANGVFNWYDASAGGNLLGTGNPFMVAPSTTTNYWVSETLNNCESARTLFVVTVTPLAVPFAATPAAICPGQTTTLVASGALANGVFKWYDAATNGNLIYTGNNFTVNPSFTTDYWVTESNATCESDRFLVTVTVNPLNDPTVNAGIVCPGQTFDLVATSGGANGIFEWFDASGNLLFVGNPFSVSPSATTDYFVVEMANGCQTNAIQTTVTVAPLATVTALNLSTCPGNSVTFVATGAVAGGVYNWYNAATGGNLLFTGSNFTVTPSVTTNYWVSQAANGCESNRTQRTVTVTPVTAPTASATAICPGETSVATAVTGGANGVFNWYDASSGGNLLGTGNPFMVAPSATTNYWVSETLNNCESARTLFVVTVTPLAVPFAATPAAICPGQTTTLVASGALANGVFKWYDAATNGNLIYTGNNYTVSPSFTTDYWVTESNATCESDRFLVTVTVNPLNDPTVNAGSVCPGQTFDLVATSGGANGIFEWYDLTGNLLFVGNPFTVSPSATTDYFVIEKANGCQTNAIQTTVTVAPLAAVTAPNLATCPGNSVTFVATGAVAGGVYNWYNAATGGNLLFTGSNFTVTPSVTTNYWVSQAANGCESNRTQRTVTVTPVTAPTASATAICPGETSVATATTGGANGVFNWYDAASGGNLIGTGNPFMFAPSTTTNYWVSEVLNGCESARTLFTVTVAPLANPTATAVNTAICEGSSEVLTASAAVPNGTFNWYDAAAGGNLLFTGNPYYTPVLNDTITYWVSVSNATCTSDRIAITVTVNPKPVISSISNNGPLCDGATLQLSANASAGVVYQWVGPTGFSSVLAAPTITNVNEVNNQGAYNLTVQNPLTGCTSASSFTIVQISPIPQTPTLTSNSAICEGTTLALTTNTVAGATYNWSGPAGTLGSGTTANWDITPADPSMSGTYTVNITVDGCTSPDNSTAVTVKPRPAMPSITATNNGNICVGGDWDLTASTLQNAEYYWTSTTGFSSTLQTVYFTQANPAAAGLYYVSVTLDGCESQRDSVLVTINAAPSVPGDSIWNNSPICEGGTLELYVNPLNNVSYQWTGPNGYTSNVQNPVITNVIPSVHEGVYSLVVSFTATGCATDMLSTMVVISPTPQTVSATNDGPVCQGAGVQFTASSLAGASYMWTGPNGFTSTDQNPYIATTSLQDTGNYSVSVMLNGCGSSIASTELVVSPAPVISAGADITAVEDEPVQLMATGGNIYVWSPATTLNNPYLPNPIAHPTVGVTTYYVLGSVTGTNTFCSGKDSVKVTVTPKQELEGGIGDVFSPNGDGINDTWTVAYLTNFAAGSYQVTVYDRGGNKVIDRDDYNSPWNGTYELGNKQPVPDGTYWYIIKINDTGKTYKGAITIIDSKNK